MTEQARYESRGIQPPRELYKTQVYDLTLDDEVHGFVVFPDWNAGVRIELDPPAGGTIALQTSVDHPATYSSSWEMLQAAVSTKTWLTTRDPFWALRMIPEAQPGGVVKVHHTGILEDHTDFHEDRPFSTGFSLGFDA